MLLQTPDKNIKTMDRKDAKTECNKFDKGNLVTFNTTEILKYIQRKAKGVHSGKWWTGYKKIDGMRILS